MLTSIALSILMNLTPPSVHNTGDLDFKIPSFKDAPRISLGDDLRENRPKLKHHNDDLLRLLRKQFGDKYTIIRWRDAIIIKPKENNERSKKSRNKQRKRRR